MVAKDHPEAIGWRKQLIDVDVLDYDEAAEYAFINHDGDDSD